MLLELHDLDRSLRAAGIVPGATDRRIQPYPRRPALEVRLGRGGEISGLGFLSDEQLGAIRKFECSQGGLRESSPGFNVDPLWRNRAGDRPFNDWLKDWRKAWKSAGANPQKCAELLEERGLHRVPNWDFSESSKINACLKKAALTLRKELGGATDPTLLAVLELLSRSESLDAPRLHAALADAILTTVTTGSMGLTPELCRKLLYSDREPGSVKPAPNEGFSLVLELDDASGFGGRPVNHQTVWEALNRHLLSRQPPFASMGTTPDPAAGTSGIFGEPLPQKLGTMPDRTLPRVGKIKLFSLSAQLPCHHRYGLVETDACPVRLEVQDRLSAALEWICRPEREGQTWEDVSNACGYKQPALLLAYPSKLSADGPRLSEMMGGRIRDRRAVAESRFKTRAESVVKALKGLTAEDPDLSITVIVIAKADTARKKLLYSRQFTARRMIDAAAEWQDAARNIPPIFIRAFEEKAPVWRRPAIPFPGEVVQVVNTWWDSTGETSKPISNVRIGLALALLLETGPPQAEAAREALRNLVRNVTPLVLALARSHSHGRVAKATAAGDLPLLVPSTLGLLLAKSGQLKGEYMTENAYLIGRLMSLADEFHRQYCEHERNRAFPTQLIGNVLMPTALENPVAGLARLAERLTLYQRVAESELRDQAGAVAGAIQRNELPTRCSEADKAQMLLGYLARPNSGSKTDMPLDSHSTNHQETGS